MTDSVIPRGWRYADHIVYHTPDSLDDLHGPTSGVIRVRPHIRTAPEPTYDFDSPGGLWAGYSAIVRDGYPDEHAAFLDRATLLRLWPDLNLPKRCREAWTAKFAELRVLPVRALVV
ncbi:hypothetical protein [Propionicicella superfundia]|uniref:hypothetical protein n=1 Tax=Propionicicella superfundia TaxID=348582 RepID=UPI000406D2D7|nr:hypothetical protein [Propionicicella superfundia]